MTSITTQLQDNAREMCIRTWGAVQRVKTRAREQRGQTAAEYMGILLLVGLVIFALVTTVNVPGKISDAVGRIIDAIAGGNDPKTAPAPAPAPSGGQPTP